jgi:hypothetical protein
VEKESPNGGNGGEGAWEQGCVEKGRERGGVCECRGFNERIPVALFAVNELRVRGPGHPAGHIFAADRISGH